MVGRTGAWGRIKPLAKGAMTSAAWALSFPDTEEVQNVDVEGQWITIDRTASESGSRRDIRTDLKSRAGERIVAVPDIAKPAVRRFASLMQSLTSRYDPRRSMVSKPNDQRGVVNVLPSSLDHTARRPPGRAEFGHQCPERLDHQLPGPWSTDRTS
jgi:hypothetical protein